MPQGSNRFPFQRYKLVSYSFAVALAIFLDPDQRLDAVSGVIFHYVSPTQFLLVGHELPHAVDTFPIIECVGSYEVTSLDLEIDSELSRKDVVVAARIVHFQCHAPELAYCAVALALEQPLRLSILRAQPT